MEREKAIEVVKEAMPTLWKETKDAIQTLIPELTESDDERIRKELIKFFSSQIVKVIRGIPIKDILAYLEKQKEHKLVTFEEPCNSDEYEVVEIGNATCLRRKEQKPAEQIEESEEKSIGTTLIDALNGNARLEWELKRACVDVKKLISYMEERKPAEWSEEDEAHRAFILESLEDQIRFCKKDAEGAYYAKQIRTAQNWLKSLPTFWKPSEQEKGALRTAIHILTDERNFPKAAAHLQNILNTFEGEESRKEQKPSEEEINALNYAYCELFKRKDVGHNILGPLQKLCDKLRNYNG